MSHQPSVSEAAEALVRAACLDLKVQNDAASSAKVVAAIASLGTKIDATAKATKEMKASTDDKLNSVTQHLGDVKSSLDALKSSVDAASAMRSLEFAFDHADIGSFQYHADQTFILSKDLVKNMLLSFRQDRGHYLPKNARLVSYTSSSNSQTEFENKLIAQIYNLTGVKPCIVDSSDGRRIIYYS
jgi:hypothetical protein